MGQGGNADNMSALLQSNHCNGCNAEPLTTQDNKDDNIKLELQYKQLSTHHDLSLDAWNPQDS
jgi:hypothetical protein